jgi:nucleoside-diphosphate-sugar epimerase
VKRENSGNWCRWFIGYHTARALLSRGDEVVGIDNLNHYYDVNLKHARLEILRQEARFEFMQIDLSDRDFTYIDDLVRSIVGVLDNTAEPDPSWINLAPNPVRSREPYRLYNLGNQQPIELLKYIEVLEKGPGRTAKKNLLPMQSGDVPDTWADVGPLITDIDYQPDTSIEEGIKQFVNWYIQCYKIVL